MTVIIPKSQKHKREKYKKTNNNKSKLLPLVLSNFSNHSRQTLLRASLACPWGDQSPLKSLLYSRHLGAVKECQSKPTFR
jgi:hypothetical protein